MDGLSANDFINHPVTFMDFIALGIPVQIDDVHFEMPVNGRIEIVLRCEDCSGSGYNYKVVEGKGIVLEINKSYNYKETCDKCHGKGYILVLNNEGKSNTKCQGSTGG